MPNRKSSTFIGFTDMGQPLVLAEGCCEYWQPGKNKIIGGKSCWYCKYADFRKTTQVVLSQSVCRCPHNQVSIENGMENELLGGEKQ